MHEGIATLSIAVVDNGIHGLRGHFVDSPALRYRFEPIVRDWSPAFAEDVVIVPNGSDHLSLYRARHSIEAVLARGGAVLCFCGCYTPWLPGTVWRHDNTRPNRDVRYHVASDPLGLMAGVDPQRLGTDAHGISGWWACGELVTACPQSVVLADTWGRPVLIADTRSTPGLIVATASGPLGDRGGAEAAADGPQRLYRNIIRAVSRHLESRHA
ncbi:MAG: hypothetical protein KGJ32_04885 [Xanthomonadaceae bacterium]|nr:hypothetical protein [Xanthomonadaceae bacterium]